jgi:hypothetical protein
MGSSEYILNAKRCDGQRDCNNGEDEESCVGLGPPGYIELDALGSVHFQNTVQCLHSYLI